MKQSPEFLRALAKNWKTPRERELFLAEMRKKDAMLDRKIRQNRNWKQDTEADLQDQIASRLEPTVEQMRLRGEIRGGARKVIISSSNP